MVATKKGCSPKVRRGYRRRAQDAGPIGTVYILHFSRPYFHARHYCGWTHELAERVEAHQLGRGSPLVQAALAAGIEVTVAATFAGTRQLERRIKRGTNTASYCPLCGFRGKNHGSKSIKAS